ncbi:MAG TPA: MFS transporter [Candidatus Sulfomarinibacteraceae bacterium]|nr:MFS transporter [Candidatus Sulfomarinibacteraceae bacterium]
MTTPFPLHKWALRRLLQIDRPVPEASDEEVEAFRERHYRWNFTVNLLDGATFWFGLSFASSSTIAPLFIARLTDSPLPVGILAVLAQGGWFLPQLFTANAVERLARKKPVVVNLGFFLERLPMLLLVLAAALAARDARLALVVFLLGYAWHSLGAGMVATAWQDLLARCFPVDQRGRFLGIATFIGTGMGTLGAALSAWLLATFPFPTNFVYTFAMAAAGITVSWAFLALTREPVTPVRTTRQSTRQFWAGLRGILQRDQNFRRFLVARLFLAAVGMGQGFITVAALRRWQVADAVVGGYTAAMLLGQTAGNLLFGMLADRFGHKLSLELCGLAGLVAYLLAWLSPAPVWYYAVFFFLGLFIGAIVVSGILVVLEFSGPQRRPTYVGLANTGVGLVGSVAPLLGAGLAEFSFDLLFALSAAAGLLGFILMRWWVREPRWASQSVS